MTNELSLWPVCLGTIFHSQLTDSAWSCDTQSNNQHTVSVRWLLILNWTFHVTCYVLSKKNETYLLEIHNALRPTLQATIVFILQSCHNPLAFSAHFTDKVYLGKVPFDVCILLLKWCMWFLLKGDWAFSCSRNTHTICCWILGNSIRGWLDFV
jgi:hypothetical protein